jgi:BirA family transcriptional regulator, biotin operon repressor / biotin---[acetyl-CoA-carboxylase] ligase
VFGEPRIHVPECESTQLLLGAELPEGAVATTEHQTTGRGRLGRTWDDAPGASILCSVLLKPPAARNVAELTLVGGLAAAETVERALGRPAMLKWPNDVLVDGKKVSGGLAEARDGVVVLGIGVNVNQTADQLPAGARLPAASLRTLDGRERDVEVLLADLLATLDGHYSTWVARGLGPLHGRIANRDFLRSRPVEVNGVSGIAQGVGKDGRLQIEAPSGTVFVASGEVSFSPTSGV